LHRSKRHLLPQKMSPEPKPLSDFDPVYDEWLFQSIQEELLANILEISEIFKFFTENVRSII
ncbi:hypothetical protein, partial [Ameyamaea chiangmaiensis]|uniref:hypothetical protein n=1 Tax=Ameyamaea chiangmaiensis TaxID=442969 RepID=UPI002231E038